MFVEGVCDLQPADEGSRGYVLVTIVYQGYLALKVIDVVLQTLHGSYLDREEVVDVPLQFSLRSKLVKECTSHVMEVLELVPRK